ncbi:MAG: NAD-binding protein [Cyanobacteria bacterium P01_A01_bin.40]
MYLIVVGASSVSKQLISIIKEQGHKVAVIEKQEERARAVMQQFDVRVFHGDIAQGHILEEADVKNADGIIAATKDDAVNLMAMVLGKHYQVENLISLLQAAEHQTMFEKLGVQVLSNPEKIVAQKLFSLVNSER